MKTTTPRTAIEEKLVVKELADALGVGKHYVYQMRRCGFVMRGETKDNQVASLGEAVVWIEDNDFRLVNGVGMTTHSVGSLP